MFSSMSYEFEEFFFVLLLLKLFNKSVANMVTVTPSTISPFIHRKLFSLPPLVGVTQSTARGLNSLVKARLCLSNQICSERGTIAQGGQSENDVPTWGR